MLIFRAEQRLIVTSVHFLIILTIDWLPLVPVNGKVTIVWAPQCGMSDEGENCRV